MKYVFERNGKFYLIPLFMLLLAAPRTGEWHILRKVSTLSKLKVPSTRFPDEWHVHGDIDAPLVTTCIIDTKSYCRYNVVSSDCAVASSAKQARMQSAQQ